MEHEFSKDWIRTPSAEYTRLVDSIRNGNVQKKMILFGAGSWGKYYSKFAKEKFKEVLFCDNSTHLQGKLYEGIPVISFEQLKNNHEDAYITITSYDYYDEILKQLLLNDLGSRIVIPLEGYLLGSFDKYYSMLIDHEYQFIESFNALADIYSKQIFCERINYCVTGNSEYLIPKKSGYPQYFEKDIIHLSDNEVFIDGGAYNGDTAEEFIKQTQGRFSQIISFEPEVSKHEEFTRKFVEYDNIQLIPYGLWSHPDNLSFSDDQDGASSISSDGTSEIQVTSIDTILNGKQATYIKLDIEGAELQALKGATETIKRYKPKLAICIYHKPEDLIEIPVFLKTLVPEYNIYIRHYNINMFETVCYATLD